MRAQPIAAIALVAAGWCVPCPAAQAHAESQTTAQTGAYLQFIEQEPSEADCAAAEDSSESPLPQTFDETPAALFAATAALAGAAATRAALERVAHLENSQHATHRLR